MKTQYFGDINDFHKYRLLRGLAKAGLKLGVCWMLTPCDGRTDGGKTEYLDKPEDYKAFAPEIFNAIKSVRMEVRESKSFAPFQNFKPEPIPGALFSEDCAEGAIACLDNQLERGAFISRTLGKFATSNVDVAFFDPDNGLERSGGKPARGQLQSGKFIYWEEVEDVFERGLSVLLYQHGTQAESRERHIGRLRKEASNRLPEARCWAFRTPHIFFLLITQERHFQLIKQWVKESSNDSWTSEFRTAPTSSPLANHFTFGEVLIPT